MDAEISTHTTIIPAGMQEHPDYYVPPYDKDVELQPNYFCRARNVKREKYCRARAGQGTDHLGQGRCKNHGGSVPIKSGRYSDVVRHSLGEQIERLEMEDEKDQLDILPEATLLRGITSDMLERWNEFFNGVIEWNKQEDIEAKEQERRPKFVNVPDLKDLGDLTKKVAEIVNMVHKQRSANAISMPDLIRVMQAMAQVLIDATEKHLKGRVPQQVVDTYIETVQSEWRKIKLAKK